MPHEEIREENTKEVLNSALNLFMEHGVEGTSVPQIAKNAGVSLSSVYRYFKNKDELVAAVFSGVSRSMEESIRQVVNSDEYIALSGADCVMRLCRELLALAKEKSKMLVCANEAESYLTRLRVKDIYSLSRDYDTVIARCFREAFEKGVSDYSIKSQTVEDNSYFLTLAISFRGFYQRIARIYAEEESYKQYDIEQVIENYLVSIHHSISMEWVRRSVNDRKEYGV